MKDVIVIKTWLDTKWKKMVFSVLFLVILNYAIYAVTSFNFFEMGIKSFLDTMGIYTEEVKSVTMESSGFENGASGHYHVTKSAEWTGLDSAYVDFYIESELQSNEKYKDVVFILDISGSMAGEKVQLIQEHSLELTEKLLKEPKNSIALISFSDEAHILTGFTNDINVSDPIIENLEVGGNTNYYDALLALEDVLEGYQEKEDTDLMVLFLSDGYPTAFNPSQQAQYQLIKSLYPSITIQGIQYEMGIEIVDAIKEISDNQFIIDLNVVNNILFQAAFEPKYYETFELVDYIDYEHFYLESVDDVEVPFGEVSLTEENGVQKVTWLVGPNTWQTGTKQRMRINLKTKEQYVGTEGFYPTNYSESFSAEIVNGEEPIIVESTLTPVLKSGYKVNYYSNSPEGCSTNDFDEVHYAFENVTISNTSPVCEGYVFKGWDTKDDIKYINSDVFRMPTRDVDFYGTWTKLGINKTMDGTVTQKVTLYKTIQEKAVLDNKASTYVSSSTGINLANISSDTNGKGVYTIANTANNTYPIHYYRGDVTDNNVLFGGYCWLIVRTTDTGGIKIVYNGIPVNGTCPNTGTASQLSTTSKFNTAANSLGYLGYMYNSTQGYSRVRLSSSATAMNKTMVISDTVTDNGDGTYTLANPITVTTEDWAINYDNYKKYFVCSTLTATTCNSLWYLNNTTSTTYTYNIVYKYGNSFEYVLDEVSGQYKYKLLDTKLIYEWSSDYSDFGNYHYTCRNLSDECGSAVYYYNIRADYPYYLTLSDGKSIEDVMSELLWDDNVNTKDSLVKTVIDDWYATNMTSYTKYLEDTVYCNDRRVANFSGWDPNGGIPNADIMFHAKLNRDLTCPNKNDQFTVSSSLGNGKLTYPVGLLTAGEATIAGDEVVGTGIYYWLMSPGVFSIHTAYVYAMSSYGEPDHIPTNYTSLAVGVRPAISLAPQVKFSAGNGSVSTPYIVDLTSVS